MKAKKTKKKKHNIEFSGNAVSVESKRQHNYIMKLEYIHLKLIIQF